MLDDLLRRIGGTSGGPLDWDILDGFTEAILQHPRESLRRRLDQKLWNFYIKNHLSRLDKDSAPLRQTLSALTGFLTKVLEQVCCHFGLSLPENRLFPHLTFPPRPPEEHQLSLAQYCLIHLGDIARYAEDLGLAREFYQLAVAVQPSNGHPYNQLAILETQAGNKLGAVFYYIRSVAIPHPFDAGLTNMEKMFAKICRLGLKPGPSSMVDTWASLLVFFHSVIYTGLGEDKLGYLLGRFRERFSTLMETSLPPLERLVHVVVLNLFIMDSVRNGPLFYEAIGFCVEMLIIMLGSPFDCSPALKLVLDWLSCNRDVFSLPVFPHRFWLALCAFLNKLTLRGFAEDQPGVLPEDCLVRCFAPLARAQEGLDFGRMVGETVRWGRVIRRGIWIADLGVGSSVSSRRFLAYHYDPNLALTFSLPGAPEKDKRF